MFLDRPRGPPIWRSDLFPFLSVSVHQMRRWIRVEIWSLGHGLTHGSSGQQVIDVGRFGARAYNGGLGAGPLVRG